MGYTFWESGDAFGVDVPVPRDGVAVAFTVVVGLFCVAVLGLMYFVVVHSEQALPEVDRAVMACSLLLAGDLAALAWIFRRQVLIVRPQAITLDTRVAGLSRGTRLARDGAAQVSAEGDGRLLLTCGGRSLCLVGLQPEEAPRVAARIAAGLAAAPQLQAQR